MYKIGNVYAEDVNHTLDYAMCFNFALGYIFITYSIYLWVMPKYYIISFLQQGLACCVFENLLWLIPFLLIWGGHIDFKSFIINALGISLPAFFIPYLHFGLSRSLKLPFAGKAARAV